MSTKAPLVDHRAKIAAIDTKIVQLIARRLEHAREIGSIKRSFQLPLRDFAHEVDVLKRARVLASELQVNKDLVENIFQQLISRSIIEQLKITASDPMQEGTM